VTFVSRDVPNGLIPYETLGPSRSFDDRLSLLFSEGTRGMSAFAAEHATQHTTRLRFVLLTVNGATSVAVSGARIP
jgi:hypothetical protein